MACAESYMIAPCIPIICRWPVHFFITLFTICLLCAGTALPVNAYANPKEKKAEQEAKLVQIRKNIQKTVKAIEAKNRKRSKMEKQLDGLERKISASNKALRKTNIAITLNQRELSDLALEQKQLNKQLAYQLEQLRAQIYSAYANGEHTQLKLLLDQKDPTQLSRINTYYDYLHKARERRIQQARNILKNLKTVRETVQNKQSKLTTLLNKQKQEKSDLLANRKARTNVLKAVKADISRTGRELDALKQNEKNIQALVQSLSEVMAKMPNTLDNSAFAKLKGTLPMPVTGRQSNQFGALRKGSDLHWQGWMIQTREGRAVKAVADGRVVFANALRGFGLLVIIDHGGGYLSLYGHNQDLIFQVGDWVSQGEPIAHAGDSGGLERPALYFELRHKGKPINPALWCKK